MVVGSRICLSLSPHPTIQSVPDQPNVPEADFSKLRTIPVARRPNMVRAEEFARPPVTGGSFDDFLASLPHILRANDFIEIVDAIAGAARAKRAVVAMIGGHVTKTGLGPVLIDLMERGVITHVATNGSTVIHDYEMARFGGTSEDVEAGLGDGTFGMAEETGREMNDAARAGMQNGWGLGEALARAGSASASPCTPPSARKSRTSIRRPTAPPSARPATGTSGDSRRGSTVCTTVASS